MNENILRNKRNKYLIVIIIFMILLVFFTFNDLKIAQWIYHPSSKFGRFFELAGTLPVPIISIFSSIALITTSQRKLCTNTVISYISSILFLKLIFSIYHFSSHLIIMLMGIITWSLLSFFITLKIVREEHYIALRQAAIIGMVATLVSVFGVSEIKVMVSRERFYRLNDFNNFSYWYQIQSCKIPDASFPSGHSAQSALTFCFMFIPNFIKKLDTVFWHKVIGTFAFIFTFCVMISRLILGAHFATDVLMGAAITIITIIVTYHLTKLCMNI